jgi:hypothetical protein
MIDCPSCGNRSAYESEEIERYHHEVVQNLGMSG